MSDDTWIDAALAKARADLVDSLERNVATLTAERDAARAALEKAERERHAHWQSLKRYRLCPECGAQDDAAHKDGCESIKVLASLDAARAQALEEAAEIIHRHGWFAGCSYLFESGGPEDLAFERLCQQAVARIRSLILSKPDIKGTKP